MYSLSIYAAVVLILVTIRKFQEKRWSRCTNNISLQNKVILITGANSGIGYEIVKNLANRKAEVVMACRNLQSARDAIRKIKETNPNAILIPMQLDLSSLKSIKSFIEEFSKKFNQIDILINNAGVSYPATQKAKTKDGFEINMGINHLGHFYLTNALLSKLESVEGSRIVIVSSKLHEKGKIDVENLAMIKQDKKETKSNLYADSKLANVYFCKELAKNTKVNVYSCCPGWVYTNLFRHYNITWYKWIPVLPIAFLFMRSPEQGAQTPIYCATEPSLSTESGLLYRDCKKYKSQIYFDEEISTKLWEKSEELIESRLEQID